MTFIKHNLEQRNQDNIAKGTLSHLTNTRPLDKFDFQKYLDRPKKLWVGILEVLISLTLIVIPHIGNLINHEPVPNSELTINCVQTTNCAPIIYIPPESVSGQLEIHPTQEPTPPPVPSPVKAWENDELGGEQEFTPIWQDITEEEDLISSSLIT